MLTWHCVCSGVWPGQAENAQRGTEISTQGPQHEHWAKITDSLKVTWSKPSKRTSYPWTLSLGSVLQRLYSDRLHLFPAFSWKYPWISQHRLTSFLSCSNVPTGLSNYWAQWKENGTTMQDSVTKINGWSNASLCLLKGAAMDAAMCLW